MSMFTVGEVIYKYTLKRRLGNGSFGEVWLADDASINQEVALKIFEVNATDVKYKLEEAIIGHKLTHANLLKVLYADVCEYSGRLFAIIAQEYKPRGSVETLLNAHGFVPLPDLLKVLKDILLGLEYLHTSGILHNDIKPGNILLDQYSNACLSDYGISSILSGASVVEPKSFYKLHSAPELQDKNEINFQTDIYQLGCTAYRLANNIGVLRADFLKGEDWYEAAKKKGKIGADFAIYVPRKLSNIIKKAMAVDLKKRYSSALDMRRDIEKLNYCGYWTTDSTDTSKFIGVGLKYKYTYDIIPKPDNKFDLECKRYNEKTSYRISKFCKKGISEQEFRNMLKDYFTWVIENAQ